MKTMKISFRELIKIYHTIIFSFDLGSNITNNNYKIKKNQNCVSIKISTQ